MGGQERWEKKRIRDLNITHFPFPGSPRCQILLAVFRGRDSLWNLALRIRCCFVDGLVGRSAGFGDVEGISRLKGGPEAEGLVGVKYF